MADGQPQPLINPALRLLIEPVREGVPGRGKSFHTIKHERLGRQREHLRDCVARLIGRARLLPNYARKTLIVAEMFADDSLAPTHTPTDLLNSSVGCRLVAPLGSAYLVEADIDKFSRLLNRIDSEAAAVQSDVSRIKNIRQFTKRDSLRGRSVENLWQKAAESEQGKHFVIWLRPFHDSDARESLLGHFERFASATLALSERGEDTARPRPVALRESPRSAVSRAMRRYRETRGVGRTTVAFRRRQQLARLIASGTVFRIDPVLPLRFTSAQVQTPNPVKPTLGAAPTVAVVDGGLNDPAYLPYEDWRTRAIVSDRNADIPHGNAITSLIVHAHELNSELKLPALGCRVGVVQSVPHESSNQLILPDDLLDLLAEVALRHKSTRVWNMSFNVGEPDDDADTVSDLAHQLAIIVRTTGVLPVISIGNAVKGNSRLLPPADCEAALTVGGRVADNSGNPDKHCNSCCEGPGPEGMLKPELSWYSPMKVGNGARRRGSSFPTTSVTVLAAHSFDQLKEPTPDLVRALLINRSERDSHDEQLGWGTPYDGVPPWECAAGRVTMLWHANLQPSLEYYWDDIPIPEEMIKDGKLVGGAKLTAILSPLTSPFGGPNYFSTRIEVAMQYRDAHGEWKNLLGTLQESSLSELEARTDLKKWQPIRHHSRPRFQRGFSGESFRLRARLYARDLYQPGMPDRNSVPPQPVAFVLTLSGVGFNPSIYNTMVRELGNFVQSAVATQEIIIQ